MRRYKVRVGIRHGRTRGGNTGQVKFGLNLIPGTGGNWPDIGAKGASVVDWSLAGSFVEKYAPVAQLDRASGYEPEGRVFESLRAHQINQQFTGNSPKNSPPSCPPRSRCLVNRRCVYCGHGRCRDHADPHTPSAEERWRHSRAGCRFRHKRFWSPPSESRGARGLGKKDGTTGRKGLGRVRSPLDDGCSRPARTHEKRKDARSGLDAKA